MAETSRATTQISYIPDHAARNVKRLLSQDWDKPRTCALVAALGDGAQELEDQLFALVIDRQLEVATGALLDQWGGIVGEKRGPLEDRDYRKFVQARIMANTCTGTVDEILAIWKLVTGESEVKYLPMYPAGYKLQCLRDRPMSRPVRRRVRRIMEDVKPAGVAMVLIEAYRAPFGFEGELGFVAAPTASGYGVGKLSRVF